MAPSRPPTRRSAIFERRVVQLGVVSQDDDMCRPVDPPSERTHAQAMRRAPPPPPGSARASRTAHAVDHVRAQPQIAAAGRARRRTRQRRKTISRGAGQVTSTNSASSPSSRSSLRSAQNQLLAASAACCRSPGRQRPRARRPPSRAAFAPTAGTPGERTTGHERRAAVLARDRVPANLRSATSPVIHPTTEQRRSLRTGADIPCFGVGDPLERRAPQLRSDVCASRLADAEAWDVGLPCEARSTCS